MKTRIKTRKRSVLYAPRVGFLQYTISSTPFYFSRVFRFILRRLTYNRTRTQTATLRKCHCTTSAMLEIAVLRFDASLTCERMSLPTLVCRVKAALSWVLVTFSIFYYGEIEDVFLLEQSEPLTTASKGVIHQGELVS